MSHTTLITINVILVGVLMFLGVLNVFLDNQISAAFTFGVAASLTLATITLCFARLELSNKNRP